MDNRLLMKILLETAEGTYFILLLPTNEEVTLSQDEQVCAKADRLLLALF